MRSLRKRLLYRTTAVLVMTFVAAAVVLYWLMRASLLAELDSALLFEARSLAAHVEQSGEGVQIEPEIVALPEYSNAAHSHFFMLRASDSAAMLRSRSLDKFDLFLATSPPVEPVHQSIALPGRIAGRQVTIGFLPHIDDEDEQPDRNADRPQVILAVARETTGLDATLARLRGLLLVVTIAATTLCVLLAGGVVRHELQPLGELAQSIEKIGVANLSNRIRLPDCPVELVPVVDCLDQLLGRLDEALAREKSFTADVAHELRTPLAGLETTLEVCASRVEIESYQTVVANCLRITRGMHVLVDNLLSLARADAGQVALHAESVEIAALIRDSWSPFEERAAARRLQVEWRLDDSARVVVDRDSARQIVTNLVDNAVSYAPAGGWLRISLVDQENGIVLTIANDGCALSPDDAARVFDRFWRGDASRTGDGRHCGLGLSLCKKLAELQQGTISAEIRDGWFLISVAFSRSVNCLTTDFADGHG